MEVLMSFFFQYRLVRNLAGYLRHPADARRFAVVHRAVGPAAGRVVVPVQPAPVAGSQRCVRDAVAGGEHSAFAAVHHSADRDDSVHRVDHRYLLGCCRCDSTAGGGRDSVFFARLVETALREVDRGIIEATQAMGATTRQIITNALLPEARPGIFAAITVTAITLVSYTAMAGVVGAGGLGDLAIRFGYQRFQTDVMVVTVVLLLMLVQVLQTVGDKLVVHFSRK